MQGPVQSKIKRVKQSMSLTGAIVATAVGVLLPVILSTSVGIVALALGNTSEWTLFGVLVISFAAAAIGGGVVVTVLLSRKHRIARLQADFVANVTHELRTPLTSIRLYAQTLEMGTIQKEPHLIKKSIKTILRETEWLEAMIDRVLTWRAASKDMDTPRMVIAPLAHTIEIALERFKRMVSDGEVDLNVNIGTQAMVLHDEQAVQSVVLNLLVNAYKYTLKEKKIEVRLFEIDDKVIMEVEDNGIGIDKSLEKKIFEPFYRVDSRLSGKSSGAGLGLAIVRHQVSLHKGDILLRSEQGKGSIFTVQFPTAKKLKGQADAKDDEK